MDGQPQVQQAQHQQGMGLQMSSMRRMVEMQQGQPMPPPPMQQIQPMGMQPGQQMLAAQMQPDVLQFHNVPNSTVVYNRMNGRTHPSRGHHFYSHSTPMPSPLQPRQPQQPQLLTPGNLYPSSPYGSVGSTFHLENAPRLIYSSGFSNSTPPPTNPHAAMSSVPELNDTQAIDDEASIASLQGYLDDDIPHFSMQGETSRSNQPQLLTPGNLYPSSTYGSVRGAHIPGLSPGHPINSPQGSAMVPALRIPGSVSVDNHSPAIDDEASLQGYLDDDIPHSSTQGGTSRSNQIVARHNRKRKHSNFYSENACPFSYWTTPPPANPQAVMSSVPELNDTQDRANLNLKKDKISDILGLHKFGNDKSIRMRLRDMVMSMAMKETDEYEFGKMTYVINSINDYPYTSIMTVNLCKSLILQWLADGKFVPPMEDVKFGKGDGKLIVTWTAPKWPLPLWYYGECVRSSGEAIYMQYPCVRSIGGERVVEQFKTIAKTSYTLSKVSPIQGYVVTVWAVNSKGQAGNGKTSERAILCKKHGSIFVDHTSPMRPGYNVYKGYLECASKVPDEVAVKIVNTMVQEKTLREVKALQKLKNKNIVTYRLSEEFDDRYGEKSIVIAMELCSKDTFLELVKGKKLIHCCKIPLLHMMLGLSAIHDAGFLHRDLKPQNILRSLDGKDMKVADFGLCKEMDPNKSKVTKSALEIGTEGWGSPEHYQPNAKMSEKSDIYSAGHVSAFGLSHGQHVYGSKTYNWKPSIIEGSEVNLSIITCDDAEIAKDMISKMLQRDPDKRPTAKQVLAHPFFWDDEKKLNFLHHMSSVFTPVFLKKIYPEQLTASIMDDLDAKKKSIFQTRHGGANWVKKMEETPVVTTSYQHVLLTARCEVSPYTRYDPTSVFDLIRFIRNVEEHYRHGGFLEEFNNSKRSVWKLFYGCFPTLICSVYNAVYKHLPQIGNCRDFPNEATRFFTETAHYQPLP